MPAIEFEDFAPVLSVEVLRGHLTVNGQQRPLPRRERSLLFAIAVSNGPLSQERAHLAVWPDLEDERAGNVVWVTAHRLRRRAPDRVLLRTTEDGYALGDTVSVDVRRVERLSQELEAGRAADEQRTTALRMLVLGVQNYADDGVFDLPDYVTGRVRAVLDRLAEALTADARARCDHRWSLAVARASYWLDPSNEDACEQLMRACLATGDRGTAISTFRRHAVVLRNELDLEPSSALRDLIGGSPLIGLSEPA